MLAMVVNDAACLLNKHGALESIASKLAPTGIAFHGSKRLNRHSITAAATSWRTVGVVLRYDL
ncbi:hypothetical protein [Pseudomonas sp. Pseusp16]|uniref:hypothetical protein n=2 Tax=Pseudomonas sp. Pseusp16 TaxID=3243021 RepID=UPI0039B464F1